MQTLFSIWASYVSPSKYLVLILKFYTIPVRLHNIKTVLNRNGLSSKHMSIFVKIWRHFSITSELC